MGSALTFLGRMFRFPGRDRAPSLADIAFLLLVCLFSFSCAHRSSIGSQKSLGEGDSRELPSGDLAFVLSHIEDEFRHLPTQHHDSLEKSQELLAFFQAMARLSESELERAHAAYSSQDIRSPFLKKHWKLVLRDGPSWRSWHESGLVAGTETMGIVSFLVPICPALPADLRADLLRKVGEKYSRLMKNRDPKKKRLSARRYADGAIRCLLRPGEWVTERARKLSSDEQIDSSAAREAYDAFRLKMKELVFSEQPDYGTYSAQDVLRVSRAIESWLKAELGEELQAGGELILLGSFPNFKANLETSDLDVVSRGMRQLSPAETDRLRAALVENGLGDLALPVNVDHFPDDYHHSRINPLMIRISADGVHLLAWPTLPLTENTEGTPLLDISLVP